MNNGIQAIDQEDSEPGPELVQEFRHIRGVIFQYAFTSLFRLIPCQYVVFLKQGYSYTNGKDHLDLWGIINSGPQHAIQIMLYPPKSYSAEHDVTVAAQNIIKFVPTQLVANLESFKVLSREASHDAHDDVRAICLAMMVGLAIASYSGKVWSTIVHDDGSSVTERLSVARCVDVNMQEDRSLEECIQTVSSDATPRQTYDHRTNIDSPGAQFAECIARDPRFLRIELAVATQQTAREASMINRSPLAALPIVLFRPLQVVYPGACETIGSGHARMVSIKSDKTTVKVYPVFSKLEGVFRHAQIEMKRVDAGSGDEAGMGSGFLSVDPVDLMMLP